MQVRSGKVRYIGGSNFCGWQVQKSSDVSRSRLLERFCCMQNQYSLLARDNEWEVDEVCRLEGVAMLPWSPLKGIWSDSRCGFPLSTYMSWLYLYLVFLTDYKHILSTVRLSFVFIFFQGVLMFKDATKK